MASSATRTISAIFKMKNLLKQNRERIDREFPDIQNRQFFSPALHALVQKLIPIFDTYVKGAVIDIGCGDMPFKDQLKSRGTAYDTLDITEKTVGITYVASILDMSMVKAGYYDTAVCIEVLEHVPEPFIALKQINRILKNDGLLILSAPHLSRLHEEPHDYYRYTHHGIRTLLENNGLKVIRMEPCGGLLCFLGHQFSTLLLCSFFHIPLLKHIIFFLNKWILVKPCCWIDDKLAKRSLMPLGYVCVAKKIREA